MSHSAPGPAGGHGPHRLEPHLSGPLHHNFSVRLVANLQTHLD